MDKQQPVARMPLYQATAVDGVHQLTELPLIGKINLRGNAEDGGFIKAIEGVLGVALPLAANTMTGSNKKKMFWLGPNEWLCHCPIDKVDKLIVKLRETLASTQSAVTDVSDYTTVFELTGPHIREVLSSGTPLDIHSKLFAPGHCAQTAFSHASILLWPVAQDLPCYRLQVRWSYAQYLFDYLAQSIINTEADHTA